MNKIIRSINRLFYSPQKVGVVVTAGKKCPNCGSFGLFKHDDFDMCEECLTQFDKEGNIIKSENEDE